MVGSAFRDVGGSGSAYHLVPMFEMEIMDMDPSVEVEEVKEAVRSCLHVEPTSEVKVSMM